MRKRVAGVSEPPEELNAVETLRNFRRFVFRRLIVYRNSEVTANVDFF